MKINPYKTFDTKWKDIRTGNTSHSHDEPILFVSPGLAPKTQRQLNLYYYFIFIKNILEKSEARNVLEIGCGRGTISLYLAKYLGLETDLLDNEKDAIKLAERLYEQFNQHGRFFVGDAVHTQFDACTYDAIVSIGLAEHFENPEDLFKEQFRLIKEGGVMISLNIPKKKSIQELNTVMRLLKKFFGSYQGDIRKDYYRTALKSHAFAEAARGAGFSKVEIIHVCPFPIFVPVTQSTDETITRIYKCILFFRKLFQTYPYKTNSLIAQAHFLVAYK